MRARASSVPVPPIPFAQTNRPSASSFRIKISVEPADTSSTLELPVSKSTAPANEPTRKTLPAGSTAIARASSAPVPPSARAQSRLPWRSSLLTKISVPPPAVSAVTPAPGSKSTVPLNAPAEYTLPAASTAVASASSRPLPPHARAHSRRTSFDSERSAATFPLPAASVN